MRFDRFQIRIPTDFLLLRSWISQQQVPVRETTTLMRLIHKLEGRAGESSTAAPLTAHTLDSSLGFSNKQIDKLMRVYAVCRKCWCAHPLRQCYSKSDDGVPLDLPCPCKHKRSKRACGEQLVTVDERSHRIQPLLPMPRFSLIQSIARWLQTPGAWDLLESPRKWLPMYALFCMWCSIGY